MQGAIERALREFLEQEVKLSGAGRTDAGVHALGQVAHFDTTSKLPCDIMEKALNANVPEDILASSFEEVDSAFHARYSAVSKLYRYNLAENLSPETLFLRRTAWVHPCRRLDLSLLDQCAALMVGKHNFFTFSRKTGEKKTNYYCHVLEAAWTAVGDTLRFDIQANRFLRGMIRMLVRAMVAVASGQAEAAEFKRALDEPGRWNKAMPAPACGLFLVRVDY